MINRVPLGSNMTLSEEVRLIGTKSFNQEIVGVGSPLATQSREIREPLTAITGEGYTRKYGGPGEQEEEARERERERERE